MAAPIQITNSSASSMVKGRTVFATLNHASLVSSRQSLASADDLAVRHIPTGRILPVWVSGANTAAAVVYWSLQAAVSSGATINDYELVYGTNRKSSLFIATRDLSHYHPASSGILAEELRLGPFLYYDDFRHVFDGSNWVPAPLEDKLSVNAYEVVGFEYGSTPGQARGQLQSGNFFAVHSDWHSFQHPVRVRAELLIESGATNPQHGLRSWGDETSSFDGYFGGTASTGYTSGEILIDGIPMASGTLANRSGIWTPTILSAINLLGLSELNFRAEGSAAITYSDAAGTWNQGACGVYAGNTAETKFVHVRNFWVERWDAATTQWSASITLPAPSMPHLPWRVSHTPDRAVIRSEHRPYQPVRSRARRIAEAGVYRVEWEALNASEARQLQHFVESYRASVITLSLPGMPTNRQYMIRPESLAVVRENSASYTAEVEMQLLW